MPVANKGVFKKNQPTRTSPRFKATKTSSVDRQKREYQAEQAKKAQEKAYATNDDFSGWG